MAIAQRLISEHNPYRDLPTETHIQRGRKDILCRLWDLYRAADVQKIMLTPADCCEILNNTKRGHERRVTPKMVGKRLSYLHQKGVLDHFRFRGGTMLGTWKMNAYHFPGVGKYYRIEFPSYSSDEEGQWTITGAKSDKEKREFLEVMPKDEQ